jgi:hypothetical protein
MNDMKDNSAKHRSKRIYLILGVIWLALGLFGLAFDPSHVLMGIIQIGLGSAILIYYFWVKSI